MHIADDILREVNEKKIADIFSDPSKTKVFLQLQELELITVSESGVHITEEGSLAMEMGIKKYFAHKRTLRQQEEPVYAKPPPESTPPVEFKFSYTIPAIILILLLLLLLFGYPQS